MKRLQSIEDYKVKKALTSDKDNQGEIKKCEDTFRELKRHIFRP